MTAPTWAYARDDALDRLAARLSFPPFLGYHEELLELCADVLARAGERRLVFPGRSSEELYDLLRALLRDVKLAPRLTLAPFSFRDGSRGTMGRLVAEGALSLEGIERHLDALGLDPATLVAEPVGVAFVDVTCWGTTFGNLDELLGLVARRRGVDPRQVAARTTFVGLTKASLGWTHWRRDEESQGARFFREGRAAVVPISSRLWSWLADQAPKTTDSYTRERWSEPPHLPPPDERRDRAVRRAAELVVFGSTREVRRAFAAALARRATGEAAWLGSLVTSLLRSTQPRKRRRGQAS